MNGNSIILDSNFLINILNGKLSSSLIPRDNDVYISNITFMEILGFSFKTETEELNTRKLLNYFSIIYADKNISETAILLRRGRKIKLPDAIICATAINNSAILYTNDKQLSTIENLRTKSFDVNFN